MRHVMEGRSILSAVLIIVALLTGPIAAWGEETLLTINRSVNGLSDVIELTRSELQQLDQVELRTENEFVDGLTTFTGPLARDVLDSVGRGVRNTVLLTAANDFQVEIPISDFDNYDVVFALSANGETLSPRDKGPIWVIYPMSQHNELQDPIFNARLIWQLVRIDIR